MKIQILGGKITENLTFEYFRKYQVSEFRKFNLCKNEATKYKTLARLFPHLYDNFAVSPTL